VSSQGCLVDPANLCGQHLVFSDAGVCEMPRAPNDAATSIADAAEDATLPSDSATASESADAGLTVASDASHIATGLGATCQTSADCAQFDATYCETFQSHTCLIQNCVPDPSVCPMGWSCCETTTRFGLPTLCLPAGQCPN